MGAGSSTRRPYYDGSFSNDILPTRKQQQQEQQLQRQGEAQQSQIEGTTPQQALDVTNLLLNNSNKTDPQKKASIPYPIDPTMLRTPYATRYPFQDYRFAKKVGVGRYSSIYKATKLQQLITTPERVAIKEISTHLMTALQYEDLRYEINILSQLSHENIIELIGIYEPPALNAKVYVVTEYLRGGELLVALSSQTSYSFYDIVYYFQQILAGLHHLHSHGIVHGNIIPENLILQQQYNPLFREFNIVKIVGFDYAESVVSPVKRRPIQKHSKEPKFCPPEWKKEETQNKNGSTSFYFIQNHHISDKNVPSFRLACDIWGFGVLFYFLITGSFPFIEILHYWQKTPGEPSFHEKIWEQVGEGAKDFFKKALNADPLRRAETQELMMNEWFMKDVKKLTQNDIDLHNNLPDLKSFQRERARIYSIIVASGEVNFKKSARFQDDKVLSTLLSINS